MAGRVLEGGDGEGVTQLLDGSVARVAHDEHAVLVDDQWLAEPELFERHGHGGVVDAGVVGIGLIREMSQSLITFVNPFVKCSSGVAQLLDRPSQVGKTSMDPSFPPLGAAMSEPLLRIRNHHTAQCGDPPIVNGDDPATYIGYFENPFGEQWVFTYNRDTKKAELRGGDAGWNKMFEVVAPTVMGLILSREEATWLGSCWRAATGSP
jgi:hypothetical protein